MAAETQRPAEGVYEGSIVSQRFGKSGTKETLFFEVTVRITHRQKPDYSFETLPDPFTRSSTIYITEGTMGATGLAVPQLRALGWTGTDFEEIDPASKKYNTPLEGNKCKFLCKHDTNATTGKKFDNWQVFTAKPAAESDPNVSKKLNTLFKGSFAATPKTTTPKTKKDTKPPVEQPTEDEETTSGGDDDDEVPF